MRPAHRARRRIHTRPGNACCALCSAGPPSRPSRNNTTYAIRAHWQTPNLATMPPLAHGPLSPGTARRPPGSFTVGRPSQAGWTDPARVHRVPPTGGRSATRRSRVASRTVTPLPHQSTTSRSDKRPSSVIVCSASPARFSAATSPSGSPPTTFKPRPDSATPPPSTPPKASPPTPCAGSPPDRSPANSCTRCSPEDGQPTTSTCRSSATATRTPSFGPRPSHPAPRSRPCTRSLPVTTRPPQPPRCCENSATGCPAPPRRPALHRRAPCRGRAAGWSPAR